MATESRPRPPKADAPPPAEAAPAPPKVKPEPAKVPTVPFLLDFYPLEDGRSTQLVPFFEHLATGRLTTTKCRKDGLLWPPRIVCPTCHSGELEWVDLPLRGRLYAFSAVLVGAPAGMESEVPYVVGLVDLEGAPLRLFGRIVGRSWDRCAIGQSVEVETYSIPDGRWFYRFRAPAD